MEQLKITQPFLFSYTLLGIKRKNPFFQYANVLWAKYADYDVSQKNI